MNKELVAYFPQVFGVDNEDISLLHGYGCQKKAVDKKLDSVRQYAIEQISSKIMKITTDPDLKDILSWEVKSEDTKTKRIFLDSIAEYYLNRCSMGCGVIPEASPKGFHFYVKNSPSKEVLSKNFRIIELNLCLALSYAGEGYLFVTLFEA